MSDDQIRAHMRATLDHFARCSFGDTYLCDCGLGKKVRVIKQKSMVLSESQRKEEARKIIRELETLKRRVEKLAE